jgi:hypothetical protein
VQSPATAYSLCPRQGQHLGADRVLSCTGASTMQPHSCEYRSVSRAHVHIHTHRTVGFSLELWPQFSQNPHFSTIFIVGKIMALKTSMFYFLEPVLV